MRFFIEDHKISIGLIICAFCAFFIFYYFFLPAPFTAPKEPEMNIAEESREVQVSSFQKSYSLKDLRGKLFSFTELFSGTGRKDNEKSSVKQDSNSTIITLPVQYNLAEIASSSIDISLLETKEKDSQGICIKKECLFLENGKVYKLAKHQKKDKAELIDLPFEVKKIGKATSFWLLAQMREKEKPELKNNEKKFQAAIYAYDGKKYNKLAGKEFYSADHGGEFILGGKSDKEFIAGFYGFSSKMLLFEKTQACSNNLIKFFSQYKIIDHLSACYQARDISHWFSSRLERIKGIDFFKVGQNYIFYSDKDTFLAVSNKDFLLDLTQDLELIEYSEIITQKLKDKIILTASNGEDKKYFEFEFLGFDQSNQASWISSSIAKRKIKGASVTKYLGGGEIKFYFSRDGKDWIPAAPGESIYFDEENKQPGLYWKADLIPSKSQNNFKSPFLSRVSFSYSY